MKRLITIGVCILGGAISALAPVTAWGGPPAGLSVQVRSTPVDGDFASVLASDGDRLYFLRHGDGRFYGSSDGGGDWLRLNNAPGDPSYEDPEATLVHFSGGLITVRSILEPLLTVYDAPRNLWLTRGSRLFGNTGFAVLGNTLYANLHGMLPEQGGALTLADLDQLDETIAAHATLEGLAGDDPQWFSRATKYAALGGMLYGIKNDRVSEPRGTGDRLFRVDPSKLRRNYKFGADWDMWTREVSPAEDLGALPWEIGYGSALVALPAGWAKLAHVGSQGGLLVIAGCSPSNREGYGPPSRHMAIYDVAGGTWLTGELPEPTGHGTSATLHHGKLYIKRGGAPAAPYNKTLWVIGEAGPGDLDGDGDVDAGDVEQFRACFSGPTVPYRADSLPAGCHSEADGSGVIGSDLDRDHDVDQADFGLLQRCFSGSGRPAPAGCAQ